MNLFFDSTTLAGRFSGTGIYTRNLIEGLSHPEYGLNIDCCGGSFDEISSLHTGSSVRHIPADRKPHIALNRDMLANRRGYRADAAVFPNYFIPPGWPYPSAVTIHDISFLTHPQFYTRRMRTYYKFRIRHTIKHAGIILTVSEASRNQIVERLNVDPGKVMVHNPVVAKPLQQVTSPSARPYIVYIGNIEPKKNLLNLIIAYNRAGIRDTDLVLIGKLHAPGSWTRRFLNMAGQTQGVRYLGYLEEEEMNTWLVNSKGLVNISHVEGFGISQLHALANGIPTLISNDPAQMEVAGGHSLVVDADDTGAIAGKLKQLIDCPSEKPGETAHLFLERFSREAYHSSLTPVIDRLRDLKGPLFPDFGNREPLLTRAIISGICYAAVFGSAIQDQKLYHALITAENDWEKFRKQLLKITSEYSDLFSRGENETAHRKINNHKKSSSRGIKINDAEAARRKHKNLVRLLARLPWVRAIYFSGGTVHGSGLGGKPDLDLFIVTSVSRVWLTYTMIRFASRISGCGNSLCCNYLVDESVQEIFWQRDFYTAFQLLFLRQVIRKKGTLHMRQLNGWIYHFFPNAPGFTHSAQHRQGEGHTGGTTVKTGLLYWLNLLTMFLWTSHWQKRGLKSGAGGHLWDFRRIKLHTNDHRPAVYKAYQEYFNDCLRVFDFDH